MILEKGILYWITGLSGAGKTTIGNALYYELKKKNNNLVILDGDILKKLVGDSLGYSKEDRKKRAYYYSNLCKTLTDQGISVIICTIAMYDEVREWNRKHIERYVEVFLKVDKKVLIQRDRKGLYSGQTSGKVKEVAGMDLEVEFPKNPDIVIENDGTKSVEECVEQIVHYSPQVQDTFNRDVAYWNRFYEKVIKEIQEPSDFARFVLHYLQSGKRLMDIGCGNGRDSLYFARNQILVTGVDASETAINQLQKYGIENEEILRSIESHTTGRPNMSLLDKIIYIADYIEPGRDVAPNLPEVRALAFVDIDACLYRILEDTLAYLAEKGATLDPATEETFLYYKNLKNSDSEKEDKN